MGIVGAVGMGIGDWEGIAFLASLVFTSFFAFSLVVHTPANRVKILQSKKLQDFQ
jgi:hypothetical protein